MEKVLIVGVDSVVGANCAASWSDRYDVIGISLSVPMSIAGRQAKVCLPHDAKSIPERVAAEGPDWLVYCGPAAQSSWNGDAPLMQLIRTPELARPWSAAAAACGCGFTLISSDAVFARPWLYHDEESSCFSTNAAAEAIRQMEREVTACCRRTLIVRTNAYGWSPLSNAPGLVECILEQSNGAAECSLDHLRHGTPILATDLAEILEQAQIKSLSGLYHIAGAERVNPYRFGELLARRFGYGRLPEPATDTRCAAEPQFGEGETSLQCRKVRQQLGTALPLLREGLSRLRAQSDDGFRDQFGPSRPLVHKLVA